MQRYQAEERDFGFAFVLEQGSLGDVDGDSGGRCLARGAGLK